MVENAVVRTCRQRKPREGFGLWPHLAVDGRVMPNNIWTRAHVVELAPIMKTIFAWLYLI